MVTVPTVWAMEHGTVIQAGLSDKDNVGWYALIQLSNDENDDVAFYESALELVHRPLPTEDGAEEYDEIMAGQTLMDQS